MNSVGNLCLELSIKGIKYNLNMKEIKTLSSGIKLLHNVFWIWGDEGKYWYLSLHSSFFHFKAIFRYHTQ